MPVLRARNEHERAVFLRLIIQCDVDSHVAHGLRGEALRVSTSVYYEHGITL